MRINNLIARFLVNKTTKEEWDTLESWKQESEENLSELLEMQAIWNDSIDLKEYKEYDKKSAWDLINDQIEEEPVVKKKTLSLKWIGGIAASIAILLSAALYLSSGDLEGYNHVASNGVVETLTLPDGSDISINRNSEIDYATNFTENRNVILDGEAYFDVERNEERPFTIVTDEANVRVLGTSFNIHEKENSVEVFVTSGSVEVSVGDEKVVLTKNEMVSCQDGKITKLKVPGANYLSWKSSKLIFEEAALHKVVEDLRRHYKVQLVFSIDSKAMNHPITDTFADEDFESVLETLVLITGIKYIKEGNTYVIQ